MGSKRKTGWGRRPGGLRSNREAAQLQELVCETARIIADEGLLDYHKAKNKAAQRLGYRGLLPSNRDIETALATHLNIYHATKLPQRRAALQQLALQYLELLQDFQPKICGDVLSGIVTPYSPLQIHIIAEPVETILPLLEARDIPYLVRDKVVNLGGAQQTIPIYSFRDSGTRVELWIFTEAQFRSAPMSPIHSRPMQRSSLGQFRKMLNTARVS